MATSVFGKKKVSRKDIISVSNFLMYPLETFNCERTTEHLAALMDNFSKGQKFLIL